MKSLPALLLAVGFARIALAQAVSLFNGTSLEGWRGDPAVWSVQDGAITGRIAAEAPLKHNAFLFLEGREFSDFELELDFRLTGHPSANSGVQIRSQPHGATEAKGYQADLDMGRTWAGRLYEESGRGLLGERGVTTTLGPDGKKFEHVWAEPGSFAALVRTNDWNRYRITAIGPRVELRLNGRLFSVLEDHQTGPKAGARAGRIALQTHSGPGPVTVQFRDIRITEFAHASAPAPAGQEVPPEDEGVSPPGLNLDFESGTLAGWTATGDAWKDQPIKGDTVTPRRPGMRSAHAGEYWIGGYEKHQDRLKGTLTSPPIPVNKPWGSFLFAGGSTKQTRVDILELPASNVVFTVSGKEVETMSRVAVDLGKQAGKSIAVRLVDESSAGWGHLNFDDFRLHDRKPEGAGVEGTGRLATSPVLRHLSPNPSPVTNTNARAGGIVGKMWVPEGFRVDLVAAEPDLVQPIAFCFDARGRLWVVEAVSYPQRRKDEEAADRVLIFEDTDGDGTFESRKVFLDKLNLVSGIEVGFGGVYLGAAPHLLFVPDRNGDDVPDGPAEVLLDGWGYQDTHETLNSFLWGPDGWLYGNQGVFVTSKIGKPGAPDAERVELRPGVWRFHPVTRAFEVFARGGSNQWGLDYDANGNLFMTHCRSAWGRGPTTHVVRNGHYWNQSNGNHAPFIYGGPAGFNAKENPPFQNFLLSAARYDHGEGGAGKPGMNDIYGGHSHVGTLVYQGDNWPASHRGQLFTLNLHGYQMNRQVLDPQGSTFRAVHAGADPLYVNDKQFMGVDLQTGPDGAVYISDWTDTQHCHHNAVEKWDRGNGRIYRMAWAPTWKARTENLEHKSDPELIALLDHPNSWHARTARRLLQERAAAGSLKPETAPALRQAAGRSLPALWVAAACDVLTPGDLDALVGVADPVRSAWALTLDVQRSPAHAEKRGDLLQTLAAARESGAAPLVRLAVASTLPQLSSNLAWSVATALAGQSADAGDDILSGLIWYGLAPHVRGQETRALALAQITPLPLLRDSLVWCCGREPAGREALATALARVDAAAVPRWLELMTLALEGRGKVPPTPGWAAARAALVARGLPGLEARLERLDIAHGDPAVFARLRDRLTDRKAPVKERQEAFRVLSEAGDADSAAVFTGLLDDPAFRVKAAPLVGRFGDDAAAARMVDLLATAKGEVQVALANALASRPPMARALLDAMAAGRLPKTVLTALQVRQIANLNDAALTTQLEKVWGKVKAGGGGTPDGVRKFTKLYRAAPLWSHKLEDGEAVFTKACAACHAWNGKGGNLGPDLAGAWRNGVDYFVENIVEPNAVVGEAYQLNLFTLKDGASVSGMATATPEGFNVQGPAGPPVVVKTEDIRARQVLDQSMMPPGLLEALPEKEVIDLLKFLTSER